MLNKKILSILLVTSLLHTIKPEEPIDANTFFLQLQNETLSSLICFFPEEARPTILELNEQDAPQNREKKVQFLMLFIGNTYSKNHEFNHYRARLLVHAEGTDLAYLPSLSCLLIQLLTIAKPAFTNLDTDNAIEKTLRIIARPKDHTVEDVANALTFLGNNLPVELLCNMLV